MAIFYLLEENLYKSKFGENKRKKKGGMTFSTHFFINVFKILFHFLWLLKQKYFVLN